MKFLSLITILVLTLGNQVFGRASTAAQFTVTDLGSLGTQTNGSEAAAINNNGQVTGHSVTDNGVTHAFLFTPGGTDGVPGNPQMKDLGTLGGADSKSFGKGINDSGAVVGYYGITVNGSSYSRAFLYANSQMQDLGILPGATDSVATGINSGGQITGHSSGKAFLYLGVMRDLNDLIVQNQPLGVQLSDGEAINDYVEVAANGFDTQTLQSGAYVYGVNNAQHLSRTGAVGGGPNISTAYGMNARSGVVGSTYFTATADRRAFFYRVGSLSGLGILTDLGTLSSDPHGESEARSINNNFQIVGSSLVSAGGAHGFIYQFSNWLGGGTAQPGLVLDQDRIIDLNTLIAPSSGWVLGGAAGINEKGQIVGTGTNPDGYTHAYLLTPIGVSGGGTGGSPGGPHPINVILQNSGAQQLAFWGFQGPNIVSTAMALINGSAINLPSGWQVVGAGDFNGDGQPDLVLQNLATRQIAVWFCIGNTITSGAYVTFAGRQVGLPAGWQIVGVGDFDADGQPDLVLQNSSSHQLAVWGIKGVSVVSTVDVLTGGSRTVLPASWQVAGVGDFNGDGHPDLVLQNTDNGLIAFWYMNRNNVISGSYASLGGSLITVPSGWNIGGVADHHGDGQPDLVLQNPGTRQLAFWMTSGSNITSGVYAMYGGRPANLPAGWQVSGCR